MLRLLLIIGLAACAVVQPDELSLGYAHGFGLYESDAWGDASIDSGHDVVSVGFTWYTGTTMPPKRAAVLHPDLYPEPEPRIEEPLPAPTPPPASTLSVPAPEPTGSSDMTMLYQIATLAGAAYVSWTQRHRMPFGGSKEESA